MRNRVVRRLRSRALRYVVVSAVAAALALGVAPDALPIDDGAKSTACIRPGDSVERRTPEAVVVYSKEAVRITDSFSVFGCLLSVGRRYRIDAATHGTRFEFWGPRGRYVVGAAYAQLGATDTDRLYLSLVDLQRGRSYRVARQRAGGLGSVAKLLLRADGTVIYLETGNQFDFRLVACSMRTCYDRRRYATRRVILDEGLINESSLRLTGTDGVRWTINGERRSAHVP